MPEIKPNYIEPKHLWKGYVAELSCTLGIYLVEAETNLKSLLILCDYTDKLYTPIAIDRLSLTFVASELDTIIEEGLLIDTVITAYLDEEVETRGISGLSLHSIS